METERRPLRLCSDALSKIGDGVVILDAEQRVVFWNPAAERISGLSSHEVLRQKLDDGRRFWVGPGERKMLEETIASEGMWQGENSIVASSGIPICLETTVHSLKDANGASIGTMAVIRDVTERNRERETHASTERRLKETLKIGGMGYLDWDLATNNIIWSEETCRMYGLEPGSPPPTLESTVKMVHPEDTEYVKRHLDAVVQGKEDYDIEHRMVRPDGRIITVQAHGEVKRDSNGKPIRMLGTIIDVTERKRSEEELRRSRDLMQKVLASLDEAVMVVNQETREILECNETAERMFGYSRKELLGNSTRLVHVNEETFRRFSEEVRSSVQSFGYYRSLYQARRKNGDLFPAEFFIRPIRDGRGDDISVGVVRDLSDRIRVEEEKRRLEAQLIQAQKMEAVGQLAGGVAHDFNNLLTVVNGYASVTLGHLSQSDPLYENVSEILQAGQRAAALTQQLLALGRKQIVQPRPLDLNQIVLDYENMLQRLVGEQIKLRVGLAPSPVSVMADPGQLQQVIINLIVNARDAVAQGGTVTIETGNVDLNEKDASRTGWVRQGPYGVLTISDDGIGMDAETKARIFEPFFTTKEKGRGTGLGLSTVYGIVKQSNGGIVVESEPGRGSTFKIFLPSVEEMIEERPAAEAAPKALQGSETILLVEDERDVRRLAGVMLKDFGYKVLEAANAGEAFLICEQVSEPISLMITDVVMPGMTGWQLAKRLHKMRPEMKVIYISGYADEELTNRGALQKGVHFLQKPFEPNQLAAKVREILSASVNDPTRPRR